MFHQATGEVDKIINPILSGQALPWRTKSVLSKVKKIFVRVNSGQ